ncbi:MAG: galactokinase family protein, partial [Bacteroidota bacterium]
MALPEGKKRKDPRSGSVTVKAPGRINLIGDHTDYHDGFVLPGAVVKSVLVEVLRKESSETVRLTAADLGETFSFDLNEYQPTERGWPNYIMGVVHELQKLGAKISGFEATFSSTVPMG